LRKFPLKNKKEEEAASFEALPVVVVVVVCVGWRPKKLAPSYNQSYIGRQVTSTFFFSPPLVLNLIFSFCPFGSKSGCLRNDRAHTHLHIWNWYIFASIFIKYL
jgi:hypothetical protein